MEEKEKKEEKQPRIKNLAEQLQELCGVEEDEG